MQRPNPPIVLAVALLLVASACGSATPEPPAGPGTVQGTIGYEDLAEEGAVEPLEGVMVVLCQAPAEGLPEGPVVASGDTGETEDICTLQPAPSGMSGPDSASCSKRCPLGPTW